MRYEVLIQAVDDQGAVIWGFHHDEVVPLGDDPEQNALQLAGDLIARVDEGRASVSKQAGVDVEFVQKEVAAEESRGRVRRVGRRGR
jgi:hypothetical protein